VRLEEAQLGVEVVQGGVAHLEVRSEFPQGTGDEYPVGAMRVLKRYQDSQNSQIFLISSTSATLLLGA